MTSTLSLTRLDIDSPDHQFVLKLEGVAPAPGQLPSTEFRELFRMQEDLVAFAVQHRITEDATGLASRLDDLKPGEQVSLSVSEETAAELRAVTRVK